MINGVLTHSKLGVIRDHFPVLNQQINDHPLVYLDSAATTQKPQSVIDETSIYYTQDNANVYRGIYTLCERATSKYEASRQAVRHFINAKHNHEIVFTRSATEAINLVASSFGDIAINEGDEIIISAAEHHSNIVPWQQLCHRKKATLKVIPVDEQGCLDMTAFHDLLSERTKLVAITYVSNVLGSIFPIKEIIKAAHAVDVPVLLDANQAVQHFTVDVLDLDCDFMVFSGHKMYGPTGIGVLYAKEVWLERMPPYQCGGEMIKTVTFDKTEFNVLPYKFEAGTPNMAGVIGLGEAVNFLNQVGMQAIREHDEQLSQYAMKRLSIVDGLKMIGTSSPRVGVISFVLEHAHPHDIATILDQSGVAIRAGHHCAMPLMQRFNLPATARVSLGMYSNRDDVNRLMEGLSKVNELFV